MNWKDELKQLKLGYLKRTARGFYKMSGGCKIKLLPWNDTTTNGLTKVVCDWLKYSRQYANRINTQGQVRKINGKLQFTHGTTNQGTADIDAIIHGKPVKVEIKCAATNDKVSKAQLKEKPKVEAAGGIYIIVTNMQQFVKWYKDFVNIPEQVL